MATKLRNPAPASTTWSGLPDFMTLNKLEEISQKLTQNVNGLSRQWERNLADPRRDVEDECGYPRLTEGISVELFRQLYDRNAIGNRVVEVMPKTTWQTHPTVFETQKGKTATAFEEAWDAIGDNLAGSGETWHKDEEGSPIWSILERLDIRAGIGSFGVLLIGLDDGKELHEPAEGVAKLTRNSINYKDKKGRQVRKLMKMGLGHDIRLAKNDCWLTKTEEDKLLDPLTFNTRSWNMKEAKWETRANPLSERERAIVKSWANQRPSIVGNRSVEEATSTTSKPNQDTQYNAFGVEIGSSEFPSDKANPKQVDLLYLKPFDESLVQVVRYEWNPRSPRFMKPVMYRITLNDPREQHSGVGLPMATVMVHWSRVIHVVDGPGSNDSFAPPRMRAVLDNVLALRKVYGADAEGFWRNGILKLFFETHPQLGGDVIVDKSALKDEYEQMINGLQQVMATSGMSAKAIPPAVSDPTPHANIQIEAICIKLGIPKRVFMGSERGELASSQDDAQFNDVIRGRQNGYATCSIIVPLVNRLIQMGVLPEPEQFSVEWPDLDSLSAVEKANVANIKTTAMGAYVSGGVEALMTPQDYLTRVLGYTDEEAEAIIDAAAEAQEEKMAEDALLAEEQGLDPTPPEGFEKPIEEQPQPIKVKEGEKLVDPKSVIKPAPKPEGAK